MREEKNRNVINIGTSLMVVILIGLSFAIIAALAISSSQNNYNLSKKMADHTASYYQASNTAQEIIAADDWKDQEFTVDIDDSQQLSVAVKDGKIARWQVVSTEDWEADSTQPVITLEEE
ncbi:MAG: hypothetical protein K5773_00325 [Pseudobutyrivibrio sp.]|nr:hypothetical protein [Pseudobutyrivibrio sp.]